MPYTRIVALDLSLLSTGWAEFDRVKGKVNYGLCPSTKENGLPRMSHILKFVKSKVDAGSLVMIEDFSFGSKGSALSEIHGMGYLIRYWLWQSGIKFMLIPPTVLKKFVCGKGNADKAQVVKEVYKRFGIDAPDDNTADAIGLCFIGQALIGEWVTTTSFQLTVLNDLKKQFAVV